MRPHARARAILYVCILGINVGIIESMPAEIFCFDHESKQFNSISSIGPATRWATGLLGNTVSVIQIDCLPDDHGAEIRIIPTDITPEEAVVPATDIFDGLDPNSAWHEQSVDQNSYAELHISDPKYPGQGTSFLVRHREPQNWPLN